MQRVLTGEKMVSETKKGTKRIKAAPMSHLCLLPAGTCFGISLGRVGASLLLSEPTSRWHDLTCTPYCMCIPAFRLPVPRDENFWEL
jgi:hypothetical protein